MAKLSVKFILDLPEWANEFIEKLPEFIAKTVNNRRRSYYGQLL